MKNNINYIKKNDQPLTYELIQLQYGTTVSK